MPNWAEMVAVLEAVSGQKWIEHSSQSLLASFPQPLEQKRLVSDHRLLEPLADARFGRSSV